MPRLRGAALSLRRVFALALLVLPSAAAAQTPAGPVFPSRLDVVNVAVTVRDGQGRLVSDLKQEDFVVYEEDRLQALQVFARAVEPEGSQSLEDALALNLGLLLDTSESMVKELKLSREAALRFLEAIPRARDLLTIFFDQDIRISRYDSEHQQGLIERIVEVKGGGMTALYDAIAVYLSRIEGSTGRKVLVLFTDGEDSTSQLSLGDVIRLAKSSPVTIYSIAFTPGGRGLGDPRSLKPRSVLKQLADLSGGQVFSPTASKDLPAIYEKILDELRSQYVLGFVSDNLLRDGKFRKLRVELKRKGLKAYHRSGYYGPLEPKP